MEAFVGNQVAVAGDARLLLRGPRVDPLTSYPLVHELESDRYIRTIGILGIRYGRYRLLL